MPGSAFTIDAHHHLWHYSAAEYEWINDQMAALRRHFLPADFIDELTVAGVSGAVTVQARQTLEETRWLLELAAKHKEILGVVGWAPIASPQFEHSLSALVYDLLIVEHQLGEATRFVDRHPNQVFVLDHIAKPKIAARELEPWRTQIHELSRRNNICCKVSGMVTEDSWSHWSIESLRPYLDTVVHAFGADRLLTGSDWPVCLVATNYMQWWQLLRDFFAHFSDDERANIFGATAAGIYNLKLGEQREGRSRTGTGQSDPDQHP
jgi:L-fuconolactonase